MSEAIEVGETWPSVPSPRAGTPMISLESHATR